MLSTTVAELHFLMKCFGYMSGEVANIHMEIDAEEPGNDSKNVHLPEPYSNFVTMAVSIPHCVV